MFFPEAGHFWYLLLCWWLELDLNLLTVVRGPVITFDSRSIFFLFVCSFFIGSFILSKITSSKFFSTTLECQLSPTDNTRFSRFHPRFSPYLPTIWQALVRSCVFHECWATCRIALVFFFNFFIKLLIINLIVCFNFCIKVFWSSYLNAMLIVIVKTSVKAFDVVFIPFSWKNSSCSKFANDVGFLKKLTPYLRNQIDKCIF